MEVDFYGKIIGVNMVRMRTLKPNNLRFSMVLARPDIQKNNKRAAVYKL